MIWLTIGTMVYLGGQWLLTVIVVRISGQATNGDFTLALSSSLVANAVVLFGMRPFQISDTRRQYADSIYGASRLLTGALAALVFAVSLPFTSDVGRLWPVLTLFLGFRLTEGWMDVQHGLLQRADRMKVAGIALVIRAVTECISFGLALALTHSLLTAVAVLFSVSLLLLAVIERPWTRPHTDGVPFEAAGGMRKTLHLLRACSPLLVATLAYPVMLFVPRNAIGAIWGAELLGFYGSISSPLLLITVLVSLLYTPFMPHLAEHALSGRRRELVMLALRILGAIVGLIAVVLVAVPFVGPPVLAVMFGPSVNDHMDMLWPVAASVSCTALVYLGNAILTAVRRVRWTLYAAVGALIVVLTLSDYLVRTIGPNGASLALILGQGVQLTVLAIGFVVGVRSLSTGKPPEVSSDQPS